MEAVTDFIFGGSKITADGDCSHELKRHLLLWRKAMTNLNSILKSRDCTLQGPSSQNYGFPSSHVWMWELDHTTHRDRTVGSVCHQLAQKMGTWSVTASFSHLGPYFQLRTNQRKADTYAPKTNRIDLLPGKLQISFPNLQSGCLWSFVFFLYKAFLLFWLPSNLCQMQVKVADVLAKAKLITTAGSHLGYLY